MNPSNQTALHPAAPRVIAAGNPFKEQHRKRMRRVDLLTVVAWASVAGALALWLADGGADGFSSPAGAFAAAGIVAGLAGMDLVLLMLLLAARLPIIDGALGHDRALEFHRKLGKPSLYLLLAHGVLLAVGYGLAEGLDPVSEAVALWVQVPDMWLAYVSTVLFVAVVVTSLVAVRRRFPYEFWYAIHLLTYAAVLTSLPHQFSVGGLFAEGTWQRWYWLAVCIGTGAALAHYRVLEPIVATVRHQLRITRVTAAGHGVVSVEMAGRHLDELSGSGGRFFIWRFLAPGQWWHPHPFSLSAEPGLFDGGGRLRITVRNLGRGSASLARLKPGTRVAIEGPYGLFSTASRSRRHLVLIGAGIGITPIRALLESTPFAPGDATVILRGHNQSGLYLADEILELCQRRGATLFHLTGRRPPGRQTWLPESEARSGYRLASYSPNLADADVFVCGPAGWAQSVLDDARRAGVRKEQLHYERFDW
ncbi:ferredoxin reductase family protein [Arthrobacter sp. B3I4]|uniref:ferredoxin reductase family protein n=1 Tax=Arthrobacter sp. B3I4 TaxID=3042267 RepID=UPI0027888216|nr:ferredoxin reductase family protein [Arthrobacter sp. B3I4]MDQ0754901.1 putative ferric reductase [Arthrobacter sp. B3I4]